MPMADSRATAVNPTVQMWPPLNNVVFCKRTEMPRRRPRRMDFDPTTDTETNKSAWSQKYHPNTKPVYGRKPLERR